MLVAVEELSPAASAVANPEAVVVETCLYHPAGGSRCRARAEFLVVDGAESDPITRELAACVAHVGELCVREDAADLAAFTVVPLPRPGAVFVVVNGRDLQVASDRVTYEQLEELAGERQPSVVWRALDGRAGSLTRGQWIRPTAGMSFNAMRT
jgi:hypothetical protein